MENGRGLVLIRHSVSKLVAGRPADEWPLSDLGREKCGPLATMLERCALRAIVTSDEPKAVETARRVGERLGLPVTHGTVMALYFSRCAGMDAVSLWRRLERPSFAVLSLPARELVQVVGRVD